VLVVPLQPVAAQILTVALANQICRMRVYYRSGHGLFMDLYLSDVIAVAGAPCLDRTKIVRDDYHGFVGDLAFIDTEGSQDPVYTDLGSRYILGYFSPSELIPAALVAALWVPAPDTPPPAPPGVPGLVTTS
jgi:hypothetical protein